jgi:aminomethyltransferase
MSTDELDTCKRTPFYDLHVEEGGRIVPFAGWAMPVQYAGIMVEHKACRASVGLFDVSHMGEFVVEGPGAEAFLQRMTTNDVAALEVGQAQYTAALIESGGIVDDLLVYKRAEGRYLVCVNAARIPQDWAHFSGHHGPEDDCTLVDASDEFAQLAIQGRNAEALLQKLTELDLSVIEFYRLTEGILAGVQCIVARTGYTGEDGFELFFDPEHARAVWTAIREAGQEFDLVPVGLGARDTLRLEVKFCLYGNDIDTTTTPLEARLGWITKIDKGDFLGRDALLAQKEAGVKRFLVAFELKGRGIARHGAPVVVDDEVVGQVTSGTMSPSLGKAIGLCYLPRKRARIGTAFEVEVRGRRIPAEVVKPPFYKRPY